DLDVRKLPKAEKDAVTAAVAIYKKQVRDIVEQGDLYRLESPYERPRAALDFVSPDRAKAVLFVYQLKDADSEPVKLGGLDPQPNYRVRTLNQSDSSAPRLACEGQTLTGAALMRYGLDPLCSKAFDSAVIFLSRDNVGSPGNNSGAN